MVAQKPEILADFFILHELTWHTQSNNFLSKKTNYFRLLERTNNSAGQKQDKK